MNKKEMIDYILSIETSAVSAADLKKMKASEVKDMYERLKSMRPDEGEGEDGEDGEDGIEGTEDGEEECSYKEHIRELIYNMTLDTLMDNFNKYFQDTTNYKIDNEMEQAFPIDGCWTNFNTANIKLWGNWEMSRWTDENDLEFAKQIKERYGFNF